MRNRRVSVLNREPMGMKPGGVSAAGRTSQVSVLNREPMGMKRCPPIKPAKPHAQVSVLNREPMGMKRTSIADYRFLCKRFSAQPRADGDEARRQSLSSP